MFTVLDKKKAKPVPIKEAQEEAQDEAQDQVSDEEAGKMLVEMLGGAADGKDLRTMMLYGR